MNRALAILTVAALFLSGVAIGALGMHLYYAQRLTRPGAPVWMAARHFGPMLEEQLGLDEEQRQEVGTILRRSQERARSLRREMRPQVHQIVDETVEQIRGVLTLEQQEAFDRLRSRERRRLEMLLLAPEGHGPRGGPPHRRGRLRHGR